MAFQRIKSKIRSPSYLRRFLNQKAFDNLTSRISKPTHRSFFGRQIKKPTQGPATFNEKYYFMNLKKFKSCLKEFNAQSSVHGQYWQCVGHVNINMKFCTQCFNNAKDGSQKSELYFINKFENVQARTALCYSCISSLIYHTSIES